MTATTTIRSYSAHTPQWQRFQTQLMAPSHQVAAIAAAKDNRAEQVHPYARQYAHVYHQRYQQLAPFCWKSVKTAMMTQTQAQQESESSGNVRQVPRILELQEGQMSFVVGTLVKESSSAVAATADMTPLVPGSECYEHDAFFLEDDSGRVALSWNDEIHAWPTGAVVAVRGTVGRDGTMQVTHMLPPMAAPTVETMHVHGTVSSRPEHPKYVLILSGLECGNPAVPPTARDVLLSFLQGRLGHPAAPHVTRLLVAGGLACKPATKEALHTADTWFQAVLTSGIPCDVLPGAQDPTTANWPQRPLHRSLLPRSSTKWALYRTPNPYQAKYEYSNDTTDDSANDDKKAVVVVATDGTNVRAQQKFTCLRKEESGGGDGNEDVEKWQRPTELQVMEQHLRGRHLCPVGPAHVPTVPHAEQDPMVLANSGDGSPTDDNNDTDFPHLYVTGGASAFGTCVTDTGTRLVAVPSFGTTGTAVLVELSTLQVQLLKFVDETE